MVDRLKSSLFFLEDTEFEDNFKEVRGCQSRFSSKSNQYMEGWSMYKCPMYEHTWRLCRRAWISIVSCLLLDVSPSFLWTKSSSCLLRISFWVLLCSICCCSCILWAMICSICSNEFFCKVQIVMSLTRSVLRQDYQRKDVVGKFSTKISSLWCQNLFIAAELRVFLLQTELAGTQVSDIRNASLVEHKYSASTWRCHDWTRILDQ